MTCPQPSAAIAGFDTGDFPALAGEMTETQTCLTSLAVACCANTEEGLSKADSAIDAFLREHGRDKDREALGGLQAAFAALSLDGHVADYVRGRLAKQMAMTSGSETRE
jgi:hypothetical protein